MKIFRLTLSIVMLFLLVSTPALAINSSQGTAYTINELGMSMNIPSDLYVFTRDIASDDPNPSHFDLTREEFINYFNINNIYLNAVSEEVTYEIVIYMVKNTDQNVSDFTEYSDTELQVLLEDLSSTYEMNGVTYDNSVIYTGNPQVKFIKSSFQKANGDKPAYGLQYFTVYDGKEINITLDSYDKTVTPDREAMISKVIDSITLIKKSAPIENAGITGALNAASTGYRAGITGFVGTDFDSLSGIALIWLLLFDIIATFVLFTLPMFVYRYLVIKEPLLKQRAKKIAIIYGLAGGVIVGAYIVFSLNVFLAIGVFLWSYVNYLVLSKGGVKQYIPFKSAKPAKPFKPAKPLKPAKPKKTSTVKITPEPDEKVGTPSSPLSVSKTCKNCFAVNLADSKTCFYCGAQMDRDEKENRID